MRKLLCLIFVSLLWLNACRTTQVENPKQTQNPNDQVGKIQTLIKQLDDNKPQVRENATNELILIDKPAEPYLQETLKRIKGKNAEVEWRTKLILKEVAVRERVILSDGLLKKFPNIYRDLATGDVNQKFDVIEKVARRYYNDGDVVDKIIEDNIGSIIREAVHDGVKGLSLRQKWTILSPVIEFEKIEGNKGYQKRRAIRSAIPYIKELLKDESSDTRRQAIYALVSLRAMETIPQIKEMLKDEEALVRRSAVDAIGKLVAKDAIPEIREMLKDVDADVCLWSAYTLRQLGVSEEEIEKAKN